MSQGLSGESAGTPTSASTSIVASPTTSSQTSGWLWVTNPASGTSTLSLTQPLPGWRDIFTNPTDPPLPAPVQMLNGSHFPDGAWDPLLKAAAIAACFAAIPEWAKKCDPGPPDDSDAGLQKDLTALAANAVDPVLTSVTRVSEITAQANDFTPYWANLLSCSAASRPATWGLVLVGLQIGGLAAAYYKLRYIRARAAQVWPVIAPIIPTPAHPSYPSGHALQSHLIAELVKLAVPTMGLACDILANRIAFNRELAGVHFPSDTAASKEIVARIMPLLTEVPEFNNIIQQVKLEWGETRNVAPPALPVNRVAPPKLPPTTVGASVPAA